MLIINDSTREEVTHGAGFQLGLDLSNKPTTGYRGLAEMFPSELIIPKNEWQARIKEMEDTKTRLSDIITQYGLPCKDQQQTNYCWCNAPTHCMEIVRALQGQRQVILSAASVGGPIKNFWNVGGWGGEALQWIADKGVVPESMWPANQIKSSLYTDAAKTEALNYTAPEWWEIKTIEEYISCLLRRIPVAIGLAWWSHEITAYDPVWVDGDIATRCRNSWGMSYGDNGGYLILQGRKMIPDDMVAARVAPAVAA